VPESPYDVFPYVVAAWLAIGVCVTVLVPGFADRIASRLGLAQSSPSSRPRSTASDRVEAESLR
jgi:hypothetical protein